MVPEGPDYSTAKNLENSNASPAVDFEDVSIQVHDEKTQPAEFDDSANRFESNTASQL